MFQGGSLIETEQLVHPEEFGCLNGQVAAPSDIAPCPSCHVMGEGAVADLISA